MNRIIRRIIKGTKLITNSQYRRGLSCGVGAAIEHSNLIRTLPLKTLLDVGANVGQFSLLVRHEHPEASIMAFEPLATPAATYRKLFANDQKTVLYQSALGPERKHLNMHVSNRHDSSSLLEISSLQTTQFPGTEEIGREDVAVAPMTDFIKQEDLIAPVLLKIDVQGFELEVLKSAGDLLPSFQWIYVEASFKPLYEGQALAHEILFYLQDRGFILKGFFNPSYDSKGLSVQADFLFARND